MNHSKLSLLFVVAFLCFSAGCAGDASVAEKSSSPAVPNLQEILNAYETKDLVFNKGELLTGEVGFLQIGDSLIRIHVDSPTSEDHELLFQLQINEPFSLPTATWESANVLYIEGALLVSNPVNGMDYLFTLSDTSPEGLELDLVDEIYTGYGLARYNLSRQGQAEGDPRWDNPEFY